MHTQAGFGKRRNVESGSTVFRTVFPPYYILSSPIAPFPSLPIARKKIDFCSAYKFTDNIM